MHTIAGGICNGVLDMEWSVLQSLGLMSRCIFLLNPAQAPLSCPHFYKLETEVLAPRLTLAKPRDVTEMIPVEHLPPCRGSCLSSLPSQGSSLLAGLR